MKGHEAWREQLALSLYGELGDQERAELERHLEVCQACRGFERELELGLGALLPPRPAIDPPFEFVLPAQESRSLARRRWARAAALAASFAAGFALALSIARGPSEPSEPVATAPPAAADPAAGAYDAWRRATPPPLAAIEGGARIGAYLRR